MNSKDLRGIELIPDYFKYQIDAVKIEGRMKSPLYVANAVQQYRRAIDLFSESPDLFTDELEELQSNLNRASNRGFTTASLKIPAEGSSISYDWNGYSNSVQFIGIVHEQQPKKSLITTKQPLRNGDKIRYISPTLSEPIDIVADLESLTGHPIERAIPNQRIWLKQSLCPQSLLIK